MSEPADGSLMAWIGVTNGPRIGLAIEGYEFPTHKPKPPRDHGPNWLIMRGKVESDGKRWSFRHPCLTTWEVEELATWMVAVSAGECPTELSFTEPLLAFKCIEHGTKRQISVTLAHEALPKSSDGTRDPSAIYQLAIDADEQQVRDFAHRIRQQLKVLPER